MPRRPQSFRVAVVVFLNAEGVDAHDAVNVGELVVSQTLHMAAVDGVRLGVDTRAGIRTAEIGTVLELGRASSNGLIGLTTSAAAYKP